MPEESFNEGDFVKLKNPTGDKHLFVLKVNSIMFGGQSFQGEVVVCPPNELRFPIGYKVMESANSWRHLTKDELFEMKEM